MTVLMCQLEGRAASTSDNKAVRILVCDVSIFGHRTKWVKTILKRHLMVLCFAHGVGASVAAAMCYDRRG